MRNASQPGEEVRAQLNELSGARTMIGVIVIMLVCAVAMAAILGFGKHAGRENHAALTSESAVTRLHVLLRGLNFVALTAASLDSIAAVKDGVNAFQVFQEGNAELHAQIGPHWLTLRSQIGKLMRERRNIAFDDDAMIEMGQITAGAEKLMAKLQRQAEIRRDRAETAEKGAEVATIIVGVLMFLASAGAFISRESMARKVLVSVRASETQLREITDGVPALIGYIDTERRYRFGNNMYEEVFGLKPEQLHGRTIAEVIGDEAYAEIRSKVDEVLSGYPVRFERTQRDVQGRMRDFGMSYIPCYADEAAEYKVIGFYTFATDITETKRIDRMKNEFVSMVSHELRTPLTSIRGSLGLLAGGVAGNLPDAAKSLVDISKNNCERLIRLINSILDIEKMESGKMRYDLKVVELQPLLAQSVAANEGFARQLDVSLKLLARGEAVRVNIDSDSMSQVVTNLLSNAVKFSPPGGSVDVVLTRAQGRVRVEVRDRGPGIPEEFRSRIFQKFSQADSSDSRQKAGSGLGLSISKSIVERLGGTIGFTTEMGAGTTFFFELPEWLEAPASVSAGPREFKRPCVLVCEDDPDIARLIGMMLDRAGYDTDLAPTAARARELAAANPYAAMTVDLKLPDQDGIALMRALRDDERTALLPIVVVSAMSEQGRIELNDETLSVSDWLGKPIDANRLVIAIRDAVARGARDRPRILHVEDDPDIQQISAAIARDFAIFEFAATLQEARARLRLCKYDLILLDLNLAEGEGSGWSLVSDIDALDPAPPVVVFSARDVSRVESERVAAVLVKGKSSNEEWLETIQLILSRAPRVAAKSMGAEIAKAA